MHRPTSDRLATAFVDEVAFAPVRKAVGLDECEIAFSGAAPIPPEVVEFLRDIGLEMSEIYGMSESTGGMTWEPHRVRAGTVGTAYPDTEVRLAAVWVISKFCLKLLTAHAAIFARASSLRLSHRSSR